MEEETRGTLIFRYREKNQKRADDQARYIKEMLEHHKERLLRLTGYVPSRWIVEGNHIFFHVDNDWYVSFATGGRFFVWYWRCPSCGRMFSADKINVIPRLVEESADLAAVFDIPDRNPTLPAIGDASRCPYCKQPEDSEKDVASEFVEALTKLMLEIDGRESD